MKIRTAVFAAAASALIASSGLALAAYNGQFNIIQWAGATLGAATGWGVVPSGNVVGVNANVLPFVSAGHYVNMTSVTTSANHVLTSFTGTAPVLKNYGTTQIAIHGSTSSTTVTVATADAIIEPGACWQIGASITNIAAASVVSGAISGTGQLQAIDGSGTQASCGGGGGSSGSSGNVTVVNTSGSPVPTTPANVANTNVTLAGTNNVGVLGQVFGNTTVPISILSSNTPTTVVIQAGVGGQLTYVSTLAVEALSGSAWSLEEGTGTTCGTGTHVLTGNIPMTGTLTGANGGASPTIQTLTVGDDLCAVVTTLTAYGGWMQLVQK